MAFAAGPACAYNGVRSCLDARRLQDMLPLAVAPPDGSITSSAWMWTASVEAL